MKIAFWGPTPFAGRKSSNLLFMAVLFIIFSVEAFKGQCNEIMSDSDKTYSKLFEKVSGVFLQ